MIMTSAAQTHTNLPIALFKPSTLPRLGGKSLPNTNRTSSLHSWLKPGEKIKAAIREGKYRRQRYEGSDCSSSGFPQLRKLFARASYSVIGQALSRTRAFFVYDARPVHVGTPSRHRAYNGETWRMSHLSVCGAVDARVWRALDFHEDFCRLVCRASV